MTSWFLLSVILGFSLGLSDRSWIITPSVFRCNETEIILIHTFDSTGTCLRLQLKNEANTTVINDTGKELLIKRKKKFKLGVFNDNCINDYVNLVITSYKAITNFGETDNAECHDVADGNILRYKIPVKKNVGYIFIQTDLPIYYPNDSVQIQIFRLNENMYPVNTSVVMIIKDPSNSEITSQIFHDKADIISTSFKLKISSQIGVWTISVNYAGKKALKKTNIRFLVQEYVMPKFEIQIEIQPQLISKMTNFVNVTISAMYFYNKSVDGKVYLNYGNNGDKISKKLDNGTFFQRLEITGERCGAFHISAKVVEKNTRMTEYKTDSTANFINSDSVPNDKMMHKNQPQPNKLYLKTIDEKEYYEQGEFVHVLAENCWQIHYCIIGRGRIVKCGKEQKYPEEIPEIVFELTEDMIPLAELITYCIEEDKRINSTASLSFKVLDICSQKNKNMCEHMEKIRETKKIYKGNNSPQKQLEVNILPKKDSYSPQEKITIQMSGSQGQTIALSLVDDAVHVISNRYRLTTDFVRKKLLAHNLESFANLKDPNKFRFPNDEDDLPEALYQRLVSEKPEVLRYNYFPASTLFKTFSLSNNEVLNVNLTLPDSLTRWHIQAISLSKNSPFCVYEPKQIITFKYMVSRLHVPQNVKKYGMFEIKFILYNYDHQNVEVNITLAKTIYICSKHNEMRVIVSSQGSVLTKFVAYAMQTGYVPVSVTIEYKGIDGNRVETIEKLISIQDQQVSKPKILTFFLEKTDGYEDSAVSGMTCNERTVLGDIVTTTLQEPEKLMHKSHGSGNQNIIYMAMSVYVLKYILNTKQMSQEIYNNGTKFIRMGIEKQKLFQKNDGSYSTYADTKSSVWLTAFVLKIFCQASEFEEIDEELTRQAVFWLLKQQKVDGTFEDTSYVHTDIMGGRSTLELTAFVLISLMECRQIHAKEIYENEVRINLSMRYLEKNFDNMNDTLTLAITTYALTLTISNMRISAWEKLSNSFPPWEEHNSLEKPMSVLIAAYALLTQLQYDDIKIAFSIFNWLIQQKDKNGMFSSTQNTVIALQALAEYAIKWNAPDLDLKIIRPAENHNVQANATINKNSFLKKTNPSEGSTENQIKITSIGVRSTYIQVLTDFNIFNVEQKKCHFNISYSLATKSSHINSPHCLKIILKYNGKSTMETPVLELDLLSGYYMENNEFNMMNSSSNINKLEENGKRILTFFLRKLEPGEKMHLNLTLKRGNVRKLTPSSIKIYNYDKPDESCVMLYPKEKYFNLFCDYKECLCPAGCPPKDPPNVNELWNIFCKPNQAALTVNILHKKTDNLTDEQKQSRVIYSATIDGILIKNLGISKDIKKAEVIMDKTCQMSNLEKGKYIIMTNKYMRTHLRYKFWIDGNGLILDFESSKRKYNLTRFVGDIHNIQRQKCVR